MFLTKVALNIKNPSVRGCLQNAQDLHRNIQKFFNKSRKDCHVLYQMCVTRQALVLYIQSDEAPVETEETRRNGMSIISCNDMTDKMTRMKNGQYYRFNLIASPAKRDTDPEHKYKNNPYHRLYKEEDLAQWITRKAEAGGFEIRQMDTRNLESKKVQKKGARFQFGQTQFSGILKITDAGAFIRSIADGFGRERAYGSGLMLVCPM